MDDKGKLLPAPDDPDIAYDQPQGEDADESTNQDFIDRYGDKSNGSS